MNLKQRAAALAMAAVTTVSLAACGEDTTWAAKMGEETMPAGVYILNQIDAYYSLQDEVDKQKAQTAEEEGAQTESEKEINYLKEQIDGKSGSQYVTDKARAFVNEYYAVNKLFEEKGLSLSEQDRAVLQQNREMAWQYSGSFYEKNGVAQSSLDMLTENYYKRQMLFTSIYGEGGEKAVPDAELEALYTEQNVRVRYITFPLTKDGAAMTEAEAAEVEKVANSYLERAQKGENLTALINEYRKSTAAEGAEVEDLAEGAGDIVLSKENTSLVARELATAPLNELKLFHDPTAAYYVGMRVETMFDRNDFEMSKSGLLHELKQEEFDAWLFEQASGLSVTYNEAAISRYTPEKLKFDFGA